MGGWVVVVVGSGEGCDYEHGGSHSVGDLKLLFEDAFCLILVTYIHT